MVGMALIFLMSCMALYGLLKLNYITLNILTIFVFFQNIVLVLISQNISTTIYNIIIIVKEVYVVLVILWSFRNKRSVDRIERICYFSLIILFVLFLVHSKGGLMGSLVSLRQLYLPFVFYIFGKSINITKADMQKSILFFIKISVVCVLFGFFEMALGDRFWALIGIKKYMAFKGFDRFIYAGEFVPGSFYSYDFYPLIPRLRRMASVFVDPVICGQILGIALVIVAFYKDLMSTKRKCAICSVLLGIGLILSLAKGGIVIAVISALMLIRKLWHKKIFSTLCIIAAVIFTAQYVGFGLSNDLSVSAHINGLINGIDIVRDNVFGVGIGGFGNLGNIYSTGDVEAGESFIGAALGQMGVFAIVIYISFYYLFLKKLKKMAEYDSLSEILFWLNIGLLVTLFVNNTAMSFTNCYIFYILAALNLKVVNKNSYISRDGQLNQDL